MMKISLTMTAVATAVATCITFDIGMAFTAHLPPKHTSAPASQRLSPQYHSSLIAPHYAFTPSVLWDEKDKKASTTTIPSSIEQRRIVQPRNQISSSVWSLHTKQEYEAFLQAHSDKLIVMKIHAVWCKACHKLKPMYQNIASSERYNGLPVVFAEFSAMHNTDFVKSMGIEAMPTIQFYAGSTNLIENFPCGPSKVSLMKRKLVNYINDFVSRQGQTAVIVIN